MLVRVGTPDDAEQIVALKRQLIATSWPPEVLAERGPLDTAWQRQAEDAARAMMGYSHVVFFVIDHASSGGLAACPSFVMEFHLPAPGWPAIQAYGGDMYVTEAERGKGLSRALMAAGERWCYDQGARLLKLESTPSARAVYEHLGFEPMGADAGDSFTTMAKPLSGPADFV